MCACVSSHMQHSFPDFSFSQHVISFASISRSGHSGRSTSKFRYRSSSFSHSPLVLHCSASPHRHQFTEVGLCVHRQCFHIMNVLMCYFNCSQLILPMDSNCTDELSGQTASLRAHIKHVMCLYTQREYTSKCIRRCEMYAGSEQTGTLQVCEIRLATHFPHYFP